MDYVLLPLAEVRSQLEALAREAQDAFGSLDDRQLSWRPGEARWSVAQCFEHLLKINQLTFQAMDDAVNEVRPPTIWQRTPILARLWGRILIRSQSPSSRKYSAAPAAQPATADIAPDVIHRFIEQHLDAAARLRNLDERRAARAIMASPFARAITYSALDGWRLIVAHDWRHIEQARRVTIAPGFRR